ncbi:MAG: Major cardiolipin synthase ClsA [Chlamydiae bacterium]|nr:Major cardiolipin synthase ClsA [Chlamydiota bacterium]
MSSIEPNPNINNDYAKLGFGEIAPGQQGHRELLLKQKIAKVALHIIVSLAIIFVAATVGLLLGGLPGAAIGAGIGIGIAAMGNTGFLVYRQVTAHKYNPPSTSNMEFPKDVPSLGEFHGGNDLLVTKDGKETTDWKLDLIDRAEQSIELCASIGGGPTFRKALEKIEERIKQKGITAHIMTTPDLLEKKDIKLLKRLAKEYPENFRYCITPLIPELLPDPHLIENHPKILVVDEKYFTVGSTNFQEELIQPGQEKPEKREGRKFIQSNISSASREMDVIGKGLMAKTLRREFYKLFAIWEYRTAPLKPKGLNNYYRPIDEKKQVASLDSLDRCEELIKNVKIKAVVSGPENQFNNCTDEYVALIKGAKKNIKIGQMFFSPAPEIVDALKEVPLDCEMTLITNSKGKNGPPSGKFYVDANRLNYPLILNSDRSKNHVYEYQVPDTVYHKKALIVDGQRSIIGSYNTGLKSHECDYELTFTIDSEAVTKKVEEVLEADLEKDNIGKHKYVRELSWQKVEKMSSAFKTRLFGNLQNQILLI